jgi:hypothetical protein
MAEGECLKVGEQEFCYSRATTKGKPCAKHVDYKKWNKVKIASWGKYLELREVIVNKKTKRKKKQAYWRACEHHHIASVAEIGHFIQPAKVLALAKATTWCISEEKNLIALPKWPLHLMHYCDFAGAAPSILKKLGDKGPLFANLPMHDQDHDLYSKELCGTFTKMAAKLAKPAKCKKPDKTLIPDLNNAISIYHTQLTTRGETHAAWKLGMSGTPGWYAPFSMSITPREYPHPLKGKNNEQWLDKLARLYEAFQLV